MKYLITRRTISPQSQGSSTCSSVSTGSSKSTSTSLKQVLNKFWTWFYNILTIWNFLADFFTYLLTSCASSRRPLPLKRTTWLTQWAQNINKMSLKKTILLIILFVFPCDLCDDPLVLPCLPNLPNLPTWPVLIMSKVPCWCLGSIASILLKFYSDFWTKSCILWDRPVIRDEP